MMENLMNILQWLIPSGGLGAVVAWIFSKTLRNLRQTKEVHDTYKTLYEDISRTIIALQDEVAELHKELGRFRRAVARAPSCRDYDSCPVQRQLLREQEGGAKPKVRRRQRSGPKNPDSGIQTDSGVEGEPVDPC